jgi:dipicolinate synthase subunit A
MFFKNFLIVGGDKRNAALARQLAGMGTRVRVFGFEGLSARHKGGLRECDGLAQGTAWADVIIGPTPCCGRGNFLNMPFHGRGVTVEALLANLGPEQIFIAGLMGPEVLALAAKAGVRAIDMLQREDLAVLNAVIAAEGALQLAMAETDITLNGSDVMVLGYGRVGKMLCKMLAGIGARVRVAVRSPEKAAAARVFGYCGVYPEELPEYLANVQVIFNVATGVILNESNLRYVPRCCVLVDLASAPYAIDRHARGAEGLKIIRALSLPGKSAPATTAKYICEAIHEILNGL